MQHLFLKSLSCLRSSLTIYPYIRLSRYYAGIVCVKNVRVDLLVCLIRNNLLIFLQIPVQFYLEYVSPALQITDEWLCFWDSLFLFYSTQKQPVDTFYHPNNLTGECIFQYG